MKTQDCCSTFYWSVPVPAQQSADLQDIMKGEASAAPMGPVTDQNMEETPVSIPVSEPMPTVSEPAPTVVPDFAQPETTPMVNQEAPVVADIAPIAEPFAAPVVPEPTQEIPTAAVPDLQQFVNNQVAEVPTMAAPVETPAPAAAPDFNAAPADTTTPTQAGTTFSI